MQDPARFNQWRDITQGKIDQPGQIIRDEYEADYVFTDLNHDDFLAAAAADPMLKEVYRDEYAAVFIVSD